MFEHQRVYPAYSPHIHMWKNTIHLCTKDDLLRITQGITDHLGSEWLRTLHRNKTSLSYDILPGLQLVL